MLIINLVITAIITVMIAVTWEHHVFPFTDWKVNGARGTLDWLNLILIAYNLYAIITTWIMLGLLTIPAILYALFIGLSFLIGWNWTRVVLFLNTVRTLGVGYAFRDLFDRMTRSLRRSNKKQ
jgi:hypothetical protein